MWPMRHELPPKGRIETTWKCQTHQQTGHSISMLHLRQNTSIKIFAEIPHGQTRGQTRTTEMWYVRQNSVLGESTEQTQKVFGLLKSLRNLIIYDFLCSHFRLAAIIQLQLNSNVEAAISKLHWSQHSTHIKSWKTICEYSQPTFQINRIKYTFKNIN